MRQAAHVENASSSRPKWSRFTEKRGASRADTRPDPIAMRPRIHPPACQPASAAPSGAARLALCTGPSARDLLKPLRRAVELHLRGQYEQAEVRLRATLAMAPELPQAHHHLAVVLEAQGRTVEAIRHLEHALDLDPELPGAVERLAGYRADARARRA